ncbi:MAG TPA: FtsX-like permease family protein [Nautiliaceae bacterium]|nr:FtsX-like permease family protein [Nautiliaceae bacterium]
MKIKFSILFAWKNFIRNWKSSVFVVLIFSLILVLPTLSKAVVNGFSFKIKKEINDFIGDFVIKTKDEKQRINLNKLNNLNFIDFYIPLRNERVIIFDKEGNSVSTQLLIVDNFEKFVEKNKLEEKIILGELNEGKKGIVLGRETTIYSKVKVFPNPLKVDPGDYVRVLIGNKSIKLRVNGIYSKEIPGLDIYALANKKFFNKKSNTIYLYLKEEYKNKRDEIFIELKNLFPYYEIRSIKEEMTTVDSFLSSFNIIANLTFFLGVIISVVIVYSLVFINVKNKRTEIGILRALGLRERYILFAYLFLVFLYLIFSFFVSILVILLFSLYFKINPIESPFGKIFPLVDYYFFAKNFSIMSIVLLFISVLPVNSVLKEKLIDQIRS